MSSYHETNDANSKDEGIPLSLNTKDLHTYRREITAARKMLRSISSSNRIRNCQRYSNGGTSDQTVVYKDGAVVESRFAKQAICGRATCPNCGAMLAMKVERKIDALIKATQDKGGKAQLIVATSRRAAQLDHEELINVQSKAYAKFLAKMSRAEKTKRGIAGIIYMPEISYTEAGINPHSNILVLYSEDVSEKAMKDVEEAFAQLWISTHEKEGMPRPTRKNGIVGQEIYNAAAVSGYLTKSYKHGFPRSAFNNGWFKENGELDEARNGQVRNPHDILRIISRDPKFAKFFITLKKGEEIIRLGGLEFGIVDKDGTITELTKLPKIIRHWLDYETSNKRRNMVTVTAVDTEEPNEIFWQEVNEVAAEALLAPIDTSKITITIPYDLQSWVGSGKGIDEVITALNAAALSVTSTDNVEEAVNEALAAAAAKLGISLAKPSEELAAA